ncbi:twin-arginine translocation signal domain-containing protein [Rhizobium sp. CF080]|uniref:twin-arginine translocation signal domain-containing protein n=1 Tax=Rhizobium sp. (strain CF080) TaxID=1144310 RepID=UPI0024781AE0|nr:twin-arginine translocation signal domain-containing protein [Rhizobium sp. CF080]
MPRRSFLKMTGALGLAVGVFPFRDRSRCPSGAASWTMPEKHFFCKAARCCGRMLD